MRCLGKLTDNEDWADENLILPVLKPTTYAYIHTYILYTFV